MPVTDAAVAIDALLRAYERAATDSHLPDLDSFLPSRDDPVRAEAVCELVRVDLEFRWARGERPDLDSYLSRYAELAEPAARAAVAFEHYRQRALAGQRPSRDDYARQYDVDVSSWPGPDAATARPNPTTRRTGTRPGPAKPIPDKQRTQQVDVRPVVAPVRAPLEVPEQSPRPSKLAVATPEPGEVVFGFRLLRELGRGAFGRVYLAEQTDLADRRVALKLSSALAAEVRTLARLQHTNIVPVYSAHGGRPFQALCMPFFGGTTLASALTDLINDRRPPTGKSLADAVRCRQGAGVVTGPDWLEAATYVEAVLRVVERLADALAHAHGKGLIHRDIKPANVLLADDGQPMLLDFNLAEDGNEAGAEKARVGGTLPYMSPEQMKAFGGGPRDQVDGRADIYALGVIMFELLTRALPFPNYTGPTRAVLDRMQVERSLAPPRLRTRNPEVTPAVEAIVRKCLQPAPAERYQSAADLRDDIARHLASLPLRHTREPSLRERMRKWVRRHPRLTSPGAIAVYAAAVLLVGSAAAVQKSLIARAERQDRERADAYRQFEDFLTLTDRVRQASGSPAGSDEVLRLGSEALDRYGVTEPGWEERDEVARLPTFERKRLRDEVGEVAFLAARAAAQFRRDA